MKASIFALLLLIVGCGGKTTTISSDTTTARSGTVFLGDSITDRWDLNAYFPSERYVNAGIDGQRTDEILGRLPDILSGQNVCNGNPSTPPLNCRPIPRPNTIVIYAGWNDLFQGTDPQQAINDIQNMIFICKNAGVQPIVATVYHFDPAFVGANFNPAIDAMNKGIRQLNVPVIDLEQVFLNQSGYTSDGVHPIPAGYAQMRDAYNVVLTAPIQK